VRGKVALVVALVATLAFNPWLPAAKDFNPGVKAVATYSRFVLQPGDILVNYFPGSFWIRPSALFYADRPLLLVTSEQELRTYVATMANRCQDESEGAVYILTDSLFWEPIQELGKIVYQSGGYALIVAGGGNSCRSSNQ
jgi:hypothetical protein